MRNPRPLVAVVDDDPSVRLSLKRLLETDVYVVEIFASASAFLEYDRGACVDCLVVDVGMPNLTGLDLQRMLLGAGFDTPIVVITGQADASSATRAIDAGAVDFIIKPFDDVVFLDAVQRAVARRRGRGKDPGSG